MPLASPYHGATAMSFGVDRSVALRIGFVTTLVSLLIGYPLAHWMARMHSRLGHALALMAVIAPLLTGIVVRTFAWMTILQDKGAINTTLIGLGLIEKPLPLMYN